MFVLTVISGCGGFGWFSGKKGATARDKAVQRYGYDGNQDELFAEAPSISPKVVDKAETVRQIYKYAPLSPNTERSFRIQEVVILSGNELMIELSRKIIDKPQAIHTSTLQFVIPKDLPHGNYQIITTISADELQKKLFEVFTVR
jgi:hypothetical protein